MWAHGFRGTGLELTVDNHPLRVFLIANGYAWAASSYSRNDYDPAAGTYAFYDRGLSHYTGSADGSDDWVGGQRSEIRVIEGLGAQLKPNGWAGEPVWHGEQPLAQV
jgi:hypothetical protein